MKELELSVEDVMDVIMKLGDKRPIDANLFERKLYNRALRNLHEAIYETREEKKECKCQQH